MRKRYNTPHRSRVVKTRMTEEEYAEFAERLSACNMSQAEFIRQAITGEENTSCMIPMQEQGYTFFSQNMVIIELQQDIPCTLQRS